MDEILLPIYVDLNRVDSAMDKIEKVLNNPGPDIDAVGEWLIDAWGNTMLLSLQESPIYTHTNIMIWFRAKFKDFINRLYA